MTIMMCGCMDWAQTHLEPAFLEGDQLPSVDVLRNEISGRVSSVRSRLLHNLLHQRGIRWEQTIERVKKIFYLGLVDLSVCSFPNLREVASPQVSRSCVVLAVADVPSWRVKLLLARTVCHKPSPVSRTDPW